VNLSAAALRVMAAKGLTLEDVAEIVAANEARADPTATERQRRCRAKKNGHAVTVTRDGFPNDRDNLTLPTPSVVSDETTPPAENPKVKPEHVLEAYNTVAERIGLPTARMTPERRRKLSGFVKRHPIDDITEAIHALECSPFLRGENDRGWKADFDFLLQPKSFTKLVEGTYGR